MSAPMTTVWVLMSGEDHEGGSVLGVFASRDAAKGAFAEAGRWMPFAVDGAEENEDGTLRVHGGCDWLELRPFPVQSQAAIPGGAA